MAPKSKQRNRHSRPWWVSIWARQYAIDYAEVFEKQGKAEKLETCLNAVTSRKTNGETWYPRIAYWNKVVEHIVDNGLWADGEDDSFVKELRERCLGGGILEEPDPGPQSVLGENYTNSRVYGPWRLKNELLILSNWGSTLRGVNRQLHHSIFFRTKDGYNGLPIDWIYPLAQLSMLESDFRLVASRIIKETMRREEWEHGRSLLPDRVAKYITVDDVEKVLRKLKKALKGTKSTSELDESTGDIPNQPSSTQSPLSEGLGGSRVATPEDHDMLHTGSGTHPDESPVSEITDASSAAMSTGSIAMPIGLTTSHAPGGKGLIEEEEEEEEEDDDDPVDIDQDLHAAGVTTKFQTSPIFAKVEALGRAIDSLQATVSRFSDEIRDPQKSGYPRKFLSDMSTNLLPAPM